ncbi:MAG: RsmB/NOP family class I SAM-dependent RNA methyltransferase [Patescibacteria group bacterium]|jgi:16S rRNA (cytosine1407-C5)-methyltransferase
MLPQELLNRLAKQFGYAAVATMTTAMKGERLTTCRVNTLKSDDSAVMQIFRDTAIQFERVKGIPHAFFIKNKTQRQLLEMPIVTSGKIYLQGLTSMLPPIVLDPKPGQTILDLCAAPGSKTTQIAALMDNRGTIIACEENAVRVEKLRNTVHTQGANVDVRCADSTVLHHELPEFFDSILADVPCSAEGRMNLSDVRSYSFWSEKNIIAHAKLQRRLLRSAVTMLKPGGTLVYSTCTLAPAENEEMIAWLLSEFPSLSAESIALPFPGIVHKPTKSVTLLPTKQYEGFFVAKMRKTK